MLMTNTGRRKGLLSVALVLSSGLMTGMSGCPTDGNNTSTSFTRTVLDSVPAGGATCVAIADFNGDGLYDVVSIWNKTGEVRLALQSQAAGQVGWTTTTLASGTYAAGARSVAIADISGDGRYDILVGTDNGHILYLRQTGSNPGALSNWNTSLIVAAEGNPDPYTDIQVADIDGDGKLEVIASQAGDSHCISIFKAPAIALDGALWTRVNIATSGRAGVNQIIPIDMNGDSAVDILSIAKDEDSDSIAWYANPGNQVSMTNAWTRHAIGHVPDPRGITLADLDGDGFYDVIVSSGSGKNVSWFRAPTKLTDLLDPTYRWAQFTIGSVGTDEAGPVAVADIDKDGVYEILVGTTGAGKLSMFESTLSGWQETVIDSTGGNYGRIIPIDLDNDHHMDIVTGVDADTSSVLWYKQK